MESSWHCYSVSTICQQLQESFRNSLQGLILYKTPAVCVILDSEPVPLVRLHPVRYPVRKIPVSDFLHSAFFHCSPNRMYGMEQSSKPYHHCYSGLLSQSWSFGLKTVSRCAKRLVSAGIVNVSDWVLDVLGLELQHLMPIRAPYPAIFMFVELIAVSI